MRRVLPIVLALAACRGEPEAPRVAAKAQPEAPAPPAAPAPLPPVPRLEPIPDDLARSLCTLRSGDGAPGLERRLGPPAKRNERDVEGGKLLVLTWSDAGWSGAATLGDGKIKVASVQAVQPRIDPAPGADENLPAIQQGVTRLADVESALGPAVRTGVAWHQARTGSTAAAHERTDHCGDLHSWILPGSRRLVTLEFHEGVLVAGRLR